jgi:hypothetical protein
VLQVVTKNVTPLAVTAQTVTPHPWRLNWAAFGATMEPNSLRSWPLARICVAGQGALVDVGLELVVVVLGLVDVLLALVDVGLGLVDVVLGLVETVRERVIR